MISLNLNLIKKVKTSLGQVKIMREILDFVSLYLYALILQQFFLFGKTQNIIRQKSVSYFTLLYILAGNLF